MSQLTQVIETGSHCLLPIGLMSGTPASPVQRTSTAVAPIELVQQGLLVTLVTFLALRLIAAAS